MRSSLFGLLALLLSTALANAVRAPAPDPSQGDGRVSAFYTWADDIPAAPGQMLRTEPLDPVLGLAMAGEQIRILYSSTNGADGKTPVAVSGAFFAPKGTPPAGGWKLMAWAHGTTGVADICAPSWNLRSQRDASYLNAWLQQGFAIVATDYQGLGTPGPHPYLLARPAANSVLDSARAVLKAFPHIANQIFIIGQSQGGGAAFASAGIAQDYAPELDIRGAVATGVPLPGAATAPPPSEEPDPTVAYALYLAIMLQQGDPSLTTDQLVTPMAQPLLEAARATCVGALFREAKRAGLNRHNTLHPGFISAFNAAVPMLQYPTYKLPRPLFVGTGAQDRDVRPARQLALARQACAAGTVTEAHLYAGLSHGETVNASLKDSIPFVRKLLEGQAITPVCQPTAE